MENFIYTINIICNRIVYIFLGLSIPSGSQSGGVEFRVMDHEVKAHLVPGLGLSSVPVEATKLPEPLKSLSDSRPPSAGSIFMDPQGRG